MKPDLTQVTAVVFCGRCEDTKASTKLLAAMLDVADFGGGVLLNHFQGSPQFEYWENYEAWKFVKTDFALHMHLDGYIVHPHKWDPDFLRYDYIGAPWPKEWVHYGTVTHQVGNGGFSLRSRRLMFALSELPWRPGPADVAVCCHHRAELERRGMQFAPVDVAARFSVEHRVIETPDKTFGFHGPKHAPNFRPWNEDRISL